MTDYSKGKIYMIIDTKEGDVYVGSTIQRLCDRFRTHNIFKDYNKEKSKCKMILIEEYPCKSEEELHMREQTWIDKIDCINKLNSYRDPKYHNEEQKKRCKRRYHYRTRS